MALREELLGSRISGKQQLYGGLFADKVPLNKEGTISRLSDADREVYNLVMGGEAKNIFDIADQTGRMVSDVANSLVTLSRSRLLNMDETSVRKYADYVKVDDRWMSPDQSIAYQNYVNKMSREYVRLSTGEWVSQRAFGSLNADDQNMLWSLGIAGFSEYAKNRPISNFPIPRVEKPDTEGDERARTSGYNQTIGRLTGQYYSSVYAKEGEKQGLSGEELQNYVNDQMSGKEGIWGMTVGRPDIAQNVASDMMAEAMTWAMGGEAYAQHKMMDSIYNVKDVDALGRPLTASGLSNDVTNSTIAKYGLPGVSQAIGGFFGAGLPGETRGANTWFGQEAMSAYNTGLESKSGTESYNIAQLNSDLGLTGDKAYGWNADKSSYNAVPLGTKATHEGVEYTFNPEAPVPSGKFMGADGLVQSERSGKIMGEDGIARSVSDNSNNKSNNVPFGAIQMREGVNYTLDPAASFSSYSDLAGVTFGLEGGKGGKATNTPSGVYFSESKNTVPGIMMIPDGTMMIPDGTIDSFTGVRGGKIVGTLPAGWITGVNGVPTVGDRGVAQQSVLNQANFSSLAAMMNAATDDGKSNESNLTTVLQQASKTGVPTDSSDRSDSALAAQLINQAQYYDAPRSQEQRDHLQRAADLLKLGMLMNPSTSFPSSNPFSSNSIIVGYNAQGSPVDSTGEAFTSWAGGASAAYNAGKGLLSWTTPAGRSEIASLAATNTHSEGGVIPSRGGATIDGVSTNAIGVGLGVGGQHGGLGITGAPGSLTSSSQSGGPHGGLHGGQANQGGYGLIGADLGGHSTPTSSSVNLSSEGASTPTPGGSPASDSGNPSGSWGNISGATSGAGYGAAAGFSYGGGTTGGSYVGSSGNNGGRCK
jgi:hypothetical protein